MFTMTKYLLLILNVVLISTLFAQPPKQTNIGFNTFSGLANCPRCLADPMFFITVPAAELKLQRQIVQGLYAELGVNFQERGIRDEVEIIDNQGEHVETWEFKEQLFFAGIPLSVLYKFRGFYAQAGATINYFAHRRFINNGQLVSTDRGIFSPIHWGTQFAVGYEFEFSNRLALSMALLHTSVYLTEAPSRFVTRGISGGLLYKLSAIKPE